MKSRKRSWGERENEDTAFARARSGGCGTSVISNDGRYLGGMDMEG